MKINRSKEWWMARARREGDVEVGAGFVPLDPTQEERYSGPAEETRIAFGLFVNLMRRRSGLTLEKLATDADIDAGELLSIEDDLQFTPEPRTVYQLARVFNVSQKALMQLAGLAVAQNSSLRAEAVRFAARSEAMQKLSREESRALESFVAALSHHQSK